MTDELFALAPFSLQPIDGRSILLVRADNGALAALDARWQRFLGLLQTFRTLRAHAAAIVAALPELRGQEAALEEGLRQLLPRGVLRSASEVLARLEGAPPQDPRPPVVCIRACDRPARLARLLASLQANESAHGGGWRYEIFDDSRDAAALAAHRALTADYAGRLDVHYYGPDEQAVWRAGWERALTAPEADLLAWLLDGAHPHNRARSTHGRLYNMIFLRHAGRRVLLLDDDATLEAWLLPEASWQPRFGAIPAGTALEDVAQAGARLQPLARDPLAVHAAALGASVPQATQALAGCDCDPNCVDGCHSADLPHPLAPPPWVGYTLNGTLGDSGASEDRHLLLFGRTLIPELIADEARYRAWCERPRCVFTGTMTPLFLNDNAFQHSTCAGLALSSLMPPVLPCGRGEDALLGALVRYLYPGTFGLRLPFALAHRPDEALPWRFAPATLVPESHGTAMLTLWVSSLPAPGEITAEERLALLAASLRASARAGLEPRLRALLQTRWHLRLAQEFALAQNVLNTSGPGCSSWRTAVTALRDALLERLHVPRAVPSCADAAEELERYAAALPVWQKVYGQSMAATEEQLG